MAQLNRAQSVFYANGRKHLASQVIFCYNSTKVSKKHTESEEKQCYL